jgi:hypothetical protein
MMAAIHAAVETAKTEATKELETIGYKYRRPADDYFNFAALRFLFLQHCGADTETAEGGDPRRAARMLHIAGKTSRYWQSKKDERKRDSSDVSEEDEQDRADGASAGERLALKVVVRALVEHASASDPSFRESIAETIEAFIAKLDPRSDQAEAVAEFARSSLTGLVSPPAK